MPCPVDGYQVPCTNMNGKASDCSNYLRSVANVCLPGTFRVEERSHGEWFATGKSRDGTLISIGPGSPDLVLHELFLSVTSANE